MNIERNLFVHRLSLNYFTIQLIQLSSKLKGLILKVDDKSVFIFKIPTQIISRSSYQSCTMEKTVLKNFAIFTGK